MKIIVEGEPGELEELLRGLGVENLGSLLEGIKVSYGFAPKGEGDDNISYDMPELAKWFDDVSWESVYLAHLIVVHRDTGDTGYAGKDCVCLAEEVLCGELEIKERAASSRVGGSRRICKRLRLRDVLFIRGGKRGAPKMYCFRSDVISTFWQLLDEHHNEYVDFLAENDLANPGK